MNGVWKEIDTHTDHMVSNKMQFSQHYQSHRQQEWLGHCQSDNSLLCTSLGISSETQNTGCVRTGKKAATLGIRDSEPSGVILQKSA